MSTSRITADVRINIASVKEQNLRDFASVRLAQQIFGRDASKRADVQSLGLDCHNQSGSRIEWPARESAYMSAAIENDVVW
jgi:hypothetical protein